MTLRSKLIRLAHANPELRPHLLPIVAEDVRRAVAELSDLAIYYLDQAAFTGKVPFGAKENAVAELVDAGYVRENLRQHWAGRDLVVTPAGRRAAKANRAMGKTAIGWDKLPPGWTQESVEKFWSSLTGDVKHKVTKCIKRMEKHMDDPGAFCASVADQVEGSTDWRKGPRKGKKAAEWLSIEQVRAVCPSCADKMASMNVTRVKMATFVSALEAAARNQ